MTKTKTFSKVLAIFLMLLTFVSVMSFSSSAATSGGENTRTINVQTKADWSRVGSESITLKQNKCKYTYQAWSWGKWVTKTANVYPNYKITIRNNNTGATTTKRWSSSSIKLSLARNTSYTITVSYDWINTWYSSNCHLGTWVNSPSWWVSSTCKASCW